MASEPEWKQDDETIYSTSLAAFRVVVYAGSSPCIWRMKFGVPRGTSWTIELTATTAHDAKVEALDRVLEWAVQLSAAAGRLKGRTEAEG